MRYLRVFKTQQEYDKYLKSGDVWLPRVSYIVSQYVNEDGTTVDASRNVAPGRWKGTLAEWQAYVDSSVAWDPSIMGNGKDVYDEYTKGVIDWAVLYTKFMEVANGGIMYVKDTSAIVGPQTDDISAWIREDTSAVPVLDSSGNVMLDDEGNEMTENVVSYTLCFGSKSYEDASLCFMDVSVVDASTGEVVIRYWDKSEYDKVYPAAVAEEGTDETENTEPTE